MTIELRGDADAQRRKDTIKSRCLILEERRLEEGEKEGRGQRKALYLHRVCIRAYCSRLMRMRNFFSLFSTIVMSAGDLSKCIVSMNPIETVETIVFRLFKEWRQQVT